MKVIIALGSAGLALSLTACGSSAFPGATSAATPAIGAGASGAQSTSTAPETPTPPPHAGPQSYRGTGDKILRIKHGDELWLATLTHTGSSNFIVTALDSTGQRGDSLVNEIAGYKGTVLLNAEEGSNTSALKIQADGAWTIHLKPPSSARRWIGTHISGKSDEVLALDTPSSGLVTMKLTHTGSSNFIVHGYTADSSESLVNEIGHYRGEVALPEGTFLIAVHADGRWTLTTS
ncbi:MAG: hypothetical protein JWP34_4938 [Massilia sp.]|nr:hypothetical protein [Massilia sp.]